jgi:hypothetical protein
MQKKRIERGLMIILIIGLAVLTLSAAGCAKAAAAAATTAATTVKTTPKTTATTTKTTVTTPTTTTTPALTQTSFSLAITTPETYADYTLPIYLTATDEIHFVWTVSGVGEHIRLGINTPDGEYVGIQAAGGFSVKTNDTLCDQLNRSDSLVFKPADQQWGNGYYIFHPYIAGKDPTVNVKILYWIVHNNP